MKKYDVFISYRHTNPDLYIANQICKELDNFVLPRIIARERGTDAQNRVSSIFREPSVLDPSAELSDEICEALRNSEYMIVIGTPELAQSPWKQKEIEYFSERHGNEKVLTVLAKGSVKESFPKILTHGRTIPLTADVRGNSNKEIKKAIHEEVIKLVAVILDCDYEELNQRTHEQTSLQKLLTTIVIAVAFAIIGFTSTYQSYKSSNESLRITEIYLKNLVKQAELSAKEAQFYLADGQVTDALNSILNYLPDEEEDDIPVAVDDNTYYALSQCLGVYMNSSSIRAYRTINTHAGINGAYVSPDERYLALYENNETTSIWSLETYKQIAEFSDTDFNFDVNVSFLFAGDDLVYFHSGQVFCQDLLTGEQLYSFAEENLSNLIRLDDETALAITFSGYCYTFQVADGTILQELNAPDLANTTINCYTINDNGNYLYIYFENQGLENRSSLACLDLRTLTVCGTHIFKQHHSLYSIICIGDDMYFDSYIDGQGNDELNYCIYKADSNLNLTVALDMGKTSIEDLYKISDTELVITSTKQIFYLDLNDLENLKSWDISKTVLAAQETESGSISLYYYNGTCVMSSKASDFIFDENNKQSLPAGDYDYIYASGKNYYTCEYGTTSFTVYTNAMTSYATETEIKDVLFEDFAIDYMLQLESYTTPSGTYCARFMNNEIQVFKNNIEIGSYSLADDNSDPSDNTTPFALSDDGSLLFVYGISNTIRVISLDTMEEVLETPELSGNAILIDMGDYFVISDCTTAYLYHKATYINIAQLTGFVGYDEKNNGFYLIDGTYWGDVYEVPFYSLDELIGFAQAIVE